jgi:DNA-binding CsgD family transcriptional regulator
MTKADLHGRQLTRRAWLLAVLVVANVLCAVFFAGDVIADFGALGSENAFHLRMEAGAAVVLMLGTAYLIIELRRLLQRQSAMELGLQAARGEMSQVIERFFADWRLSHAEKDVALLLLKGLDNEAIARLRGTATGTVRAQCARIYEKAGVDGRAQLISVFMEELLGDALKPGDHSEMAADVGVVRARP